VSYLVGLVDGVGGDRGRDAVGLLHGLGGGGLGDGSPGAEGERGHAGDELSYCVLQGKQQYRGREKKKKKKKSGIKNY
jgi:hypothetical protein